MLQQRQQRRRLQPLGHRLRREPREDAGRRFHQRVTTGIIEIKIPACQRRHHPPRERTVRRHQRGGFIEMPRLAHCNRNRKRLHLGIGRLDDREILHAVRNLLGDVRLLQPVVPLRGRGRRPHRLGHQHVAAVFRRRPKDFNVAAFDTEALQQRMHGELGMVRCGLGGEFTLRVPDAADALPVLVVEIGIEPRQHHRALGQRRHRMEELRGRRHRAGRTGGDHGPIMMRSKTRGFR